MTALARMRLVAFLRGGRAAVPLISLLTVLGIWYGGGAAPAGEGYGASLAVLFPVPAWQSKLLLDAEPDVGGSLLAIVLGLRGSVVPWPAPPIMPLRRALTAGVTAGTLTTLSLHALLWSAVSLVAYARLRHRRP